MPELPEVETIRRDLEPHLSGHHVLRLEVKDRRLLSAAQEKKLRDVLIGQVWKALGRKGKYLIAGLGNGWEIIFHLRMTGQLVLENASGRQRVGILERPLGSQYRMLLEFDHGMGLAFYDQRRFGEVFMRSPEGVWPGKTVLGPDPLDNLSRDAFIGMVKGKTTRIKPLLMDQSFLAGVGNIYAQEALFKAAIRPSRSGRKLTRDEAGLLYESLRETLLNAIERRGSTSRNYRDAFGQSGSAQDLHAVYNRGGKPCLKCSASLRETRLGGRGTVYCPQCQR
jgi:formamidopyrimidine-DNA glycosylase